MKVTRTQFNLFCNEFSRYVEKFGLLEWELRFFLKDINCLAEIITNYSGRQCTIMLTDTWTDPLLLNDSLIKELAKHEAIELLIDDICTMADCRYVTESEIIATRHSLVRRLEKVIK